MSTDGSLLVVSAAGKRAYSRGERKGYVQVYETSNDELNLIQEYMGEVGEGFGASISLSKDTKWLGVGAPQAKARTGRVYVHETNNQTLEGDILHGEEPNERFGCSVFWIESLLAVHSCGTGVLRIFQRARNNWTEFGRVTTNGSEVAMPRDRLVLAVVSSAQNDTLHVHHLCNESAKQAY
eukprot:CAMPEP_0118679762 /NCGR_PEP_ID=MMETSP0800-20121206/3965_1 /TAXON_ID=210618 ORGANISM="Striatella unipunctata, Strain CCMP2910" /NCGR_SAMPLE_ID=MMETSP0800 /ASSEMBLY_ACC=CAM_ASM_000638 /LENGTH=180 /DNA_ID=CAMNT_0006575787 /DNA_START=408 /DNA_END=950 /DNA_ORIENTATION=-